MWIYEKRLQYPVKIKRPNPQMAKYLYSQFGGPDGELGAALRYLSQRYAMPYREGIAILTDVGTEELAHVEMINAMIYQLTTGLDEDELARGNLAESYIDHTAGQFPQSASGIPFAASAFQSKGDPITDLHEDMAAEQKARTTYDNLIRVADDPDVRDALRFLRQREIVHYQRFGEALRIVQDHLNEGNFYAYNPAFDVRYKKRSYNANTGEYFRECAEYCELPANSDTAAD